MYERFIMQDEWQAKHADQKPKVLTERSKSETPGAEKKSTFFVGVGGRVAVR